MARIRVSPCCVWAAGAPSAFPPRLIEVLELKDGDEIEIHVADDRQFGVSRKPLRQELLKRLREFRGRLPADFKFDRDEANGR
jgi:antitoxin MazE